MSGNASIGALIHERARREGFSAALTSDSRRYDTVTSIVSMRHLRRFSEYTANQTTYYYVRLTLVPLSSACAVSADVLRTQRAKPQPAMLS